MTSVAHHERFRQPVVKRLGFDDGWWYFCPHFLNLGLPLVLVDACLLPLPDELGLEPFGTRRPETPLPSVDLRVRLLGDGVSLYRASAHSASSPLHFVSGHWFRDLTLPRAIQETKIGIVVGDSYALQLAWSALWTCRIGAVAVIETA